MSRSFELGESVPERLLRKEALGAIASDGDGTHGVAAARE
jgi:hypothetical protein